MNEDVGEAMHAETTGLDLVSTCVTHMDSDASHAREWLALYARMAEALRMVTDIDKLRAAIAVLE